MTSSEGRRKQNARGSLWKRCDGAARGETTVKRMRIAAALGFSTMLLAGCATMPRTTVTRTHLGQPIARGQITVEPLVPGEKGSIEFDTYANIVGAQLTKAGFNEVPHLATSEQVAVMSVEFGSSIAPPRSGLSIGLGGGSFGRRSGVGGGVEIPVAGHDREIAGTRLLVQIKRRSDGTTIWEGRGETSAPASSPEAQPATAVQRLAVALFQDFPGVSGRTMTVK